MASHAAAVSHSRLGPPADLGGGRRGEEAPPLSLDMAAPARERPRGAPGQPHAWPGREAATRVGLSRPGGAARVPH